MGRPLDEDMIIKVLERWQKAFKENSHYVSASDLSLVVKDVKELPTIQPEKAQLFSEDATSDFPEPTRIISETRAIPSDDDRVSLSEKVTATFYDDEYEEWSQKTVTVRDVLDAVCDEYTVLPPAQPEPHEGHWIWVAGDLECSKCHTRYPDLYPDYDNSVACPHCGAKMTK